jgi:hypothetical protein
MEERKLGLANKEQPKKAAEVVGSNPTRSISYYEATTAHFVITNLIGFVYSLHDSTQEAIRKMIEAKRRYYYETFSEIGL